ncbi:MAG TPA: hypothetical protein EYH19_08700 [Desulfocapsa sulfexigens]|nr:hypothetical protein [Desulfocapsa sulfexigens]
MITQDSKINILLERLDETPFSIMLVASQEQELFSFAQIKPLAEVEIQYIKYVLNKCNGNKQKAASLHGFNRKTIPRRLEV